MHVVIGDGRFYSLKEAGRLYKCRARAAAPTALHSTVTFPPPRRKVLPLDSLAASDPFKAMPAGLSR